MRSGRGIFHIDCSVVVLKELEPEGTDASG
jgi:hypothetical protein